MADDVNESNDLQRAKLLQEKETKERELALKEREIEFQRQQKEKELSLREREIEFQHKQTSWTRFSTPTVVAIVAGLIGYVGTLITSIQNRKLEREKQEATLILEAIKTGGSAEEKTKQAAANLVFLADAGLITSINAIELEKLRAKGQGAGPSLPSSRGVDFQRSASLTEELESKLQSALTDYQAHLSSIGYELGGIQDRIAFRVSETDRDRDNAYYAGDSIVVGVNLARDPEYLLSEYTWQVLKITNPRGFERIFSASPQFAGFAHGLKFYFPCSYLNDPLVGKSYRSLVSTAVAKQLKTPYIFNLGQFRAFEIDTGPESLEPHHLGEIWGGALWELREKLGRDRCDKLALAAWKRFSPAPGELAKPQQIVAQIVQAGASMSVPVDSNIIQQAFERRNLR